MEYGWNEYWEFLETFVDLRTPKGLQKFEKYLKNRSQQKPSQDFPPNVREDSLFGLCIALDKVDITDGNRHTIAKEEFDIINNRNKKKFMQDSSNKSIIIEELEPEPHVPNPFLCIEKSCLVYSQRYKNIFISNANVPTVICDTLNAAIDKFEQLSLSFIDDTRFTGFDFTKVHSRYARLVVLFGLGFWDETEGDYEIADKDRIMALFNVNPNSTNLMQNNSQVKQIMSATKSRKQQHKSCLWNFMSHYLNEFIITNCKVSSEIISPNQNPNRIDSEINCIKVWSEENSCQCQFESNTENKILTMRNNRNLMKRRELRRNLFIEKETTRTGKYKTEHIWASQREGNALTTFDDNEPSEDYWSCNSDYDSDDDMFWTPPQSPVHFLDADMLLQTDRELVEQYDIFIDGDEPTKTDMDVLNALEPIRSQIDVNLYPCIKKWFNCMELRKSDHFK